MVTRGSRAMLELAVAGGHPEREAAVLPDVPDRRLEDAPVLPEGGQGGQVRLVEEPVELVGSETSVHRPKRTWGGGAAGAPSLPQMISGGHHPVGHPTVWLADVHES